MTLKWTIPACIVLLLLVTWLAVRGMNPEATRYDHALAALDRFEMTEGALRRNMLSARAGLLHNYDPLVREGNALRDALDQLRRSGVAAAALDPLASLVAEQDRLIEEFKTDNALLLNSLAYFELLTGPSGIAATHTPMLPVVSALAAAMLHLTLDRSSLAAQEVESKLDELAAQASTPGNKQAVEVLLGHGRLLHDLLPETDKIVQSVYDLPRNQRQDTVRRSIVTHQQTARAIARRYRGLLYVNSLLLLVLLAHLGLQLRRRVLAQQRRAAFEHTLASISTRFINSSPDGIGWLVEQALGRLARALHADRAYFALLGPEGLRYTWSADDAEFPAGWPEKGLALLSDFAAEDGIVHVNQVDQFRAGSTKKALIDAGVRGWVCVSSAGSDSLSAVLGFDALHGPISASADERGLLRMAFDVVANAIARDVLQRERSRLEGRLHHAQRLETVGALASGVAHNFNNIVGAILGYTEMAEASIPFGASIGDHLEEIRQAGERARNLVDQILAFGRREKSAPQRIRLRSLLDETASLLAATMPPETRLVMGAAPDTAIVSGEPAQLQQVIINLCHNAAQAMNGAGVVEVTTDLRDISEPMSLTHGHLLPGRYVRIAVRDSGHGIGKEAFERIFEPFFTTRSAGHGLGLPTVRSIIGEHGGAMDVSSTPGQGSLFTAWLPQITLVPDREAEAPLSLTGKGETILLVDDDTNGLLRGEEIIAALGYEPVGFATAEGALSACYAAPERFDAVVIGHLAPLQKVLDFAVRLQEMVPRSPILLCAAAEEIGAETLASVGIAELVPRSFTTAVMASALGRLLASPMVVRRPRAAHDR